MRSRHIGSLDVTVVGIGCNNFGSRIDEARTREVVDAAIDAGINFFDTADIYGGTMSEVFLGRALGNRRKDVVVASKFGMPIGARRKGAKPAYVRRALEDSLKRLGTDHIDLYQLHQPDPRTPIADTLVALDEEVRKGKVREIGCSNFSVPQLRQALEAVHDGAARFVSVQNEYNLLNRAAERDVLPECVDTKTAFIPYYPLASGLLTGKYQKGLRPPAGTRLAGLPIERASRLMSDDNLEAVASLEDLARRLGHSLLELAIASLIAKPALASVIAGATSAEQVQANARAAAWVLTDEEMSQVEAIAPPA